MEDALETAWVFAFMVLLQLSAHLSDSALSFHSREVDYCITIHNFFSSLQNPLGIGMLATAVLPFDTTLITELRTAATPARE